MYILLLLIPLFLLLFWILEVHKFTANLFKSFSQKNQIEDFDSWFFEYTRQTPTGNLEDAFQMYIKQFKIQIKHEINEPESISYIRTKNKILENSMLIDPKYTNDNTVRDLVSKYQMLLSAYDGVPVESKEEQ